MAVSLQDLETHAESLAEALTCSGVRGAHWIPDLALLGLARDVYQNAQGVALLFESDVPRTAHAVARSAFEAAQEVIFLGTREDDYDYFGARARAAELHDWELGAQLANEAAPDEDPVDQLSAESLAADDAEIWARFAPEKEALMAEALEAVISDRTRKRRRQFHWSGIPRMQIAKHFMSETGGDDQTVLIHQSLYNLQSLQAHPAPRLESKSLAFDGGSFTLLLSGDPDEVAGTALAATSIAVQSVAIVVTNRLPRVWR